MSARTCTGPHWDASSNSYYTAWFDTAGNFICKDYNPPTADLPGLVNTVSQDPSHDLSSMGLAGNTIYGEGVESTRTAFDQYDPTCYTDRDLLAQQGQYTSQQITSQGVIMPPGAQPMDIGSANNLYDTNDQSAHADAFMSMNLLGSQDQQDVSLFEPAFMGELP